jgi:O-antigen ligase
MSWYLSRPSTLFDLRPVSRLPGAILSFEAIFIFFLISGNYKADLWFSWIPIDLTVIFFILSGATGLVIMFREGIYLPGLTVVSLLMIFIAWTALTGLWTPSEIYAREKFLKLATLNLWSLVATAMIIANRRERVRRFLVMLLVLGTAASFYGIARYSGAAGYDSAANASSINEAFSGNFRLENYLGHGRFYGMGALVAFAAWLRTSPFSKRGVALMGAFVICFGGLLITGGRGPTFGMIVGMMLPLALGLRFADRRLFASKELVASFALLVVMVVVLVHGGAEYSGNVRTLRRLNVLFTEERGGGSAAAHLEYWGASWPFWLEQPVFGAGIGSWPVLYHGIDIASHPHNLILEVLVEFGLVGLLLLSNCAVAAARRASVRRLREDPFLMCTAMLCINTFFNAMTSSDITQNRNLFAMVGLLVMRPCRRTSHVDAQGRTREFESSEERHRVPSRGMRGASGSRVSLTARTPRGC